MATNLTFVDYATIVPADWLNNVNTFVNYHTGRVRMVRQPNSTTAWYVFAPDGTQVLTTGTTTAGLQEAINYALNNGYGLEVYGGATSSGSSGIDHGFIFCSTGIVFPPMRTTFIRMEGVHIIFTSTVTGPGINFDSCMEVTVDMRSCEFVYQGNASCLHFAPTNPTPVDPQIAIGDSEFVMGSVVVNGGSNSYLVHFDCSNGPIQAAKFSFAELNGSGAVGQPAIALFGVVVQAASSASGFLGNVIEARHIHQVTLAGVQVGLNQINQSTLYGNIWKIPIIQTAGASGTGFNTFGSADIVEIGNIDAAYGAFLSGVLIEAGTSNNIIQVGRIAGNTNAAVVDDGTGNIVRASGQTYRSLAQINMNGSNPSIAPGTWTKVPFNMKEVDLILTYDTVNYRWTTSGPGVAEVNASVAWNGISIGSTYMISIYRNGLPVKQSRMIPSASAGGVASTISVLIPVSPTDYLEIWVWQNSGSAQAIDGAVADTWVNYRII